MILLLLLLSMLLLLLSLLLLLLLLILKDKQDVDTSVLRGVSQMGEMTEVGLDVSTPWIGDSEGEGGDGVDMM